MLSCYLYLAEISFINSHNHSPDTSCPPALMTMCLQTTRLIILFSVTLSNVDISISRRNSSLCWLSSWISRIEQPEQPAVDFFSVLFLVKNSSWVSRSGSWVSRSSSWVSRSSSWVSRSNSEVSLKAAGSSLAYFLSARRCVSLSLPIIPPLAVNAPVPRDLTRPNNKQTNKQLSPSDSEN